MLNIGDEWGGRCVDTKLQMWNFKYSIFDIQHLIFYIQYLISNIISNIRNGKGGKSGWFDHCEWNVLQIGIGRILFLLEPDKIVNATLHVIVIKILIVVVIVIRSPKFQQNKFTLRVKICFQKLLWTFNFGKFGLIVRLSLEIVIKWEVRVKHRKNCECCSLS